MTYFIALQGLTYLYSNGASWYLFTLLSDLGITVLVRTTQWPNFVLVVDLNAEIKNKKVTTIKTAPQTAPKMMHQLKARSYNTYKQVITCKDGEVLWSGQGAKFIIGLCEDYSQQRCMSRRQEVAAVCLRLTYQMSERKQISVVQEPNGICSIWKTFWTQKSVAHTKVVKGI